jgi:hypothetical protein
MAIYYPADYKTVAPGQTARPGWTAANILYAAETNAIRDAALNVKLLGAVGDGTTDDTTAINEALAEGKPVFFPPGTYKCTGALTAAAGTVIYGSSPTTSILTFSGSVSDGTRAVKLNGIGAGIVNMGINVTAGQYWSAIQFRASKCFAIGNKISFTTPDPVEGEFSGFAGCYIIYGAIGDSVGSAAMHDLLVERNEIVAAASSGAGLKIGDCIQLNGTPGASVLRNYIHDCSTDGSDHHNWGIYIGANSPYCTVQDNRLIDLDGGDGLGGIHVNDDLNSPAIGAGTQLGTRVIGNRIISVSHVGISVDFCVGALIEGNTVKDTANAVNIIANGTIDSGESTRVVNNYFETLHSTAIGDLGVERCFIAADAATKNVVISGNTFGDKGAAGTISINVLAPNCSVFGNCFATTSPATAIYAAGAKLVVFGNNIPPITGATGGIIRVEGDNSVISNNVVAAGAGDTGSTAIRVAASNCNVSDNHVMPSGSSNNNGIFVASGSNNVVQNNDIVSASTGGLSDSGTNTIKSGNSWGSSAAGVKAGRARGRSTQSGDGATVAFTIAHGLYTTPTSMVVTPGHADSRGDFHVTADATNITVTYNTAPASASDNVVLNWVAETAT